MSTTIEQNSLLNVWDRQRIIFASDLPSRLRHVLSVIDHYAGAESVCFRSQKNIASDVGVCDRQLRRSLSELSDLGIIKISRIGKCCTNRISIDWSIVTGHRRPITDRTLVSDHSPSERTSASCVKGHGSPNGEDTHVQSNRNTPKNIPITPQRSSVDFPLKNGKKWTLTKEKITEYESTYFTLDVMQHIQCALQWCVDNPSKRKTHSGMTKFLNGWLNRQLKDQTDERSNHEQNGRIRNDKFEEQIDAIPITRV
jgi:hypothetical protein